jgi:hypothetical protein
MSDEAPKVCKEIWTELRTKAYGPAFEALLEAYDAGFAAGRKAATEEPAAPRPSPSLPTEDK